MILIILRNDYFRGLRHLSLECSKISKPESREEILTIIFPSCKLCIYLNLIDTFIALPYLIFYILYSQHQQLKVSVYVILFSRTALFTYLKKLLSLLNLRLLLIITSFLKDFYVFYLLKFSSKSIL